MQRANNHRFSLFFGTFDAIVMMASIYILFPKEHPDLMQKALQHFHWAVKRFEAMATRNPLAKSALGVLHAICQRMTRSLGLTWQAVKKMLIIEPSPAYPNGTTHNGSVGSSISVSPSTTTSYHPSPSMGSRGSLSTAATSTPGAAADGFSPPQQTQLNGLSHHNGSSSSSSTTLPSAASSNPTPEFTFTLDPDLFPVGPTLVADSPFDWNPPSDFDWSSLQPIYATSDLVYHNLSRAAPGADGGMWNYQGHHHHDHHHPHAHEHQPPPQQQQQPQQQAAGGGGYAGSGGGGGGVDPDANGNANGNGSVCLTPGGGGCAALGVPAAAEGGPMLPSYGQFGGDFGDDSLWNLLNQYAPI